MKKKSLYIFAGITILLLISIKSKAMTLNLKFTKFKSPVVDKLKMIYPLLIKAGFTTNFLIKAGLAQLLLETGRFKARWSILNNNYSGIKWINKPYQKNSSQGQLSPEGNFYAKFDTPQDWANDYFRILSLQRKSNKIGRPIDALTIADFNEKLFANGYYNQTLEAKKNYLKNLQYFYDSID
tara:strand:- start:140 stop:685 length:546 start_codon:yes stop_codon:yes gene_type:complete